MELHETYSPAGIIAALKNLQPTDNPWVIPHWLKRAPPPNKGEMVTPTRGSGYFDPNNYFTALKHISLPQDHVLDYIYCKGMSGGEPLLYVRDQRHPQMQSVSEHHAWSEKNKITDFLQLDGNAESFFELLVFETMAHQFYLTRYALPDDWIIITSHADMSRASKMITALNLSLPMDVPYVAPETPEDLELTSELIKLDSSLEIRQTHDAVEVSFLGFSEYNGGFFRLTKRYKTQPPYEGLFTDSNLLHKLPCLFRH